MLQHLWASGSSQTLDYIAASGNTTCKLYSSSFKGECQQKKSTMLASERSGVECAPRDDTEVQFSRFHFYTSPRAFSASLLALRAFCSSLLALLSPPVFRTCILEFFGLLFSRFLSFSPRVFWRSRLLFGLLSSRFLDFSPRAFFADSACRNVGESPITQDHGISRDLASGLQVVLKEISIESRTIPVHHGALPFVFSLDPLEVVPIFATAQARMVDG